MSGRHSGRTSQGLRITALPRTLKLLFRLAPRQLNDEIALAKIEIKRKGIQLGVAAAFFAIALIFVAFLVVGLIVAAIMGLATIMPAWLAALLVSAAFLLIALVGGLVGLQKFKKAMPLVPEETIRGIKHDLGVAKEGSDFNAALLDPASPEAKAAKAAKAEAAAKAKAGAKGEGRAFGNAEVRDELDTELDNKPQVRFLVGAAQQKLREGQALMNHGRDVAAQKISGLSEGTGGTALRWKPLAAFAGAAAVFVVLLRKLLKEP